MTLRTRHGLLVFHGSPNLLLTEAGTLVRYGDRIAARFDPGYILEVLPSDSVEGALEAATAAVLDSSLKAYLSHSTATSLARLKKALRRFNAHTGTFTK